MPYKADILNLQKIDTQNDDYHVSYRTHRLRKDTRIEKKKKKRRKIVAFVCERRCQVCTEFTNEDYLEF